MLDVFVVLFSLLLLPKFFVVLRTGKITTVLSTFFYSQVKIFLKNLNVVLCFGTLPSNISIGTVKVKKKFW